MRNRIPYNGINKEVFKWLTNQNRDFFQGEEDIFKGRENFRAENFLCIASFFPHSISNICLLRMYMG